MNAYKLARGQKVRTASTAYRSSAYGTVLEVFEDRRALLAYVDFGDGRPTWIFASNLAALPDSPDQNPEATLLPTA